MEPSDEILEPDVGAKGPPHCVDEDPDAVSDALKKSSVALNRNVDERQMDDPADERDDEEKNDRQAVLPKNDEACILQPEQSTKRLLIQVDGPQQPTTIITYH